MDSLLVRFPRAIDWFAVALCALFLGRAAASWLQPGLPLVAAPGTTVLASLAHAYSKDVTAVVERNLFCAACPPLLPGPETSAEVGRAAAGSPVLSELPLDLLVVHLVRGTNRDLGSSAVIRHSESGRVGLFVSGDAILGARVVGIDATRVHLMRDGRPEYLDLLKGGAGAAALASVPAAAGSPEKSGAPSSDGVRRTGPSSFEVQRATLEEWLGNLSLLARAARFVPEVRDGQGAGFRLTGVRPDGVFARLGLQDGDLVSAVNGLELKQPEQAAVIYSKLRSASHLSLGLERGGRRVAMEYTIR